MVYPAKQPIERGRYPYSVKFNRDQDRVLRLLLLTHNLSYSQLGDDALAMYVPAMFQKRWPTTTRINRPSNRIGHRYSERGLYIYGLKFSREQDIVLRSIMLRNRMTFAEIMEGALAMYIPAVFDEVWPQQPRERVAI